MVNYLIEKEMIIMGMTNKITVVTKSDYQEWMAILKELGVKHQVINKSDYSGFEVEIRWAE